MWFKALLLLSLGLIVNVICEKLVTYKGYKLYEVIPKNLNQSDLLHQLASTSLNGIDFLNFIRIPNERLRVLVPPTENEEFEKVLQNHQIEFRLLDSDLSKLIEAEREANNRVQLFRSTGRITFSRYYNSYEINDYLDYLAIKYPKYVSVKTVGKSYEARDMKVITISNNVQNSNKKVFFIEAGIHAREWISSATALYVIHQLVENFNQNSYLLENTDFVIMPLINPDGYDYSHTVDRFFRKSRKPNKYCVGTDLNRNFDFHWAEIGVSDNECREIYPGSKPFSEIETQNLRDTLLSLGSRVKMYLSLHSYGSFILYPWGFTRTRPSTYELINEVAEAAAKAIEKANQKYIFRYGSQTELLYAATGNSHDYALGVAKVPISMTMELPYAGDGFHPEPSQIEEIVEAIWPGIAAMVEVLDKIQFPTQIE